MSALYIVATPIGNLDDLTVRAMKTLSEADCICAEDTRVSRVLLSRYGITTEVVPYHDFNKREAGPRIMRMLRELMAHFAHKKPRGEMVVMVNTRIKGTKAQAGLSGEDNAPLSPLR
jgi:16S rRNA C1402 (ribose-2'-O) methylase RsmI